MVHNRNLRARRVQLYRLARTCRLRGRRRRAGRCASGQARLARARFRRAVPHGAASVERRDRGAPAFLCACTADVVSVWLQADKGKQAIAQALVTVRIGLAHLVALPRNDNVNFNGLTLVEPVGHRQEASAGTKDGFKRNARVINDDERTLADLHPESRV
jgi:hypothetical protein